MMTVNEMSKRTGVSVRTLHYYDQIGLLKPEAHTAGGYRLYGEKALERLGCILMYRELQFPLQSIAAILDSPSFDRNRALRQQIELLEMQKEHLETLILMARGVLMKGTEGGYLMNFTAFDTAKLDTYAKKARETWQHTPAWQEYEEKHKDATGEQKAQEAEALMELFGSWGCIEPRGRRRRRFKPGWGGCKALSVHTCTIVPTRSCLIWGKCMAEAESFRRTSTKPEARARAYWLGTPSVCI